MECSEINHIMKKAIRFLKKQKYFLPKSVFWKIEDWNKKKNEIDEIFDVKLGWDISDYGSGDFYKVGLMHFTIWNDIIDENSKH